MCLQAFLFNIVLKKLIDIVQTVIDYSRHRFMDASRSLVNRIFDPAQLGHTQALVDLNEQRVFEGGLGCEAIEAEKVLDVKFLRIIWIVTSLLKFCMCFTIMARRTTRVLMFNAPAE